MIHFNSHMTVRAMDLAAVCILGGAHQQFSNEINYELTQYLQGGTVVNFLKTKTLKKLMLFAFLVTAVSQAQAAKYGMAGCGLGSMVFADQPGMIQIIASTLNGTSYNQSFGLTSGTLGCVENRSAASLNYIETNQVALKNDISRGQGETLTGLLNIWGCQNYDAVSSILQQNFPSISNRQEAPLLKAELQNVIQNNSTTAGICQQLI